MYGINRIDINSIYSVNYHALIDTLVTGMKYLFYCVSPKVPLLFLHTSLKPDVNTAQHTEYDGGSL